MKKYIYIMVALTFLCVIAFQSKIMYDRSQKTFYRSEEVAIIDDDIVERDAEGRIFVSNPYREQMKGKPSYTFEMEEKKENPDFIPDETVEDTIEGSIAVENAKIEKKKSNTVKKVLSSGETEMKEIIDEKLEEQNEEERKRKGKG